MSPCFPSLREYSAWMEGVSSSCRWGSHQVLKWLTCSVRETKPKRIRPRRDRGADGGGANASECAVKTVLSTVIGSKSLNTQKLGGGRSLFFLTGVSLAGGFLFLTGVTAAAAPPGPTSEQQQMPPPVEAEYAAAGVQTVYVRAVSPSQIVAPVAAPPPRVSWHRSRRPRTLCVRRVRVWAGERRARPRQPGHGCPLCVAPRGDLSPCVSARCCGRRTSLCVWLRGWRGHPAGSVPWRDFPSRTPRLLRGPASWDNPPSALSPIGMR